ncbi:hypothetical protein CBR_g37366 [Chara braunii]|uniref:HAT C-terminal dimerisation domain-containing protein n=1 Tax=Chara braunii TaxID=69332 RepID=A0A388JZP1_CHABU|nr:hypothetical protein CBR_g37366 [Chara braunii]|eukprot:GBG63280.1 hypothetical protein CBR_g37366 [Chara braunii]
MDDAERDDIQDTLDEEGREGGAREGGVADEAVREPDLPGEEVAMTSRGVGRAGPAPRAPRPELDRARREKRTVGQAAVEVPDMGRQKRARQTMIDEMYAREKLAEFTDAWLQGIYVKKFPFNAFRGPEFQKVRQAAERVPRSIQFRFSSYRVTAGTGIPSQRAKVATMVSGVRATFRHSGATILSDGRKSRSGKPLVNFLARGVRHRRTPTGRVGKHVARGCLGTHPVGSRHISLAQWVQQQIRDGEFWQRVQYAILVMSPVHQLLRRMDRGGMMMSVVYEWSQHLLHLMRRVDVPEDMIEPCVHEVAIRNLHMLEPAHATAHLLNPRRRSLTYYHSLQTTADDRRVVEECDKFLLAQTGGDPVGLLYRTVRDHMRAFHSRRGDWGDRDLSDAEAADCRGDSETERCAAWWFEHGRAHPELRTIAIRAMHLWTSASPAERNWADSTVRRCKLGFAKLAQLVEIATNLKLAPCAQQGGGYVLPWVMGTGRGGTAAEEEDEEDVEPEVWGARPDGSVLEQEIQRQIVAFHDDIDDDWTDDDDTPLSSDPTAERVYFTYGGGRDGMDSFTSVITGDVSSTAQASGSSRAGGGGGGRSHSEVRVDDLGDQQPRGGLRHTGRRWEVRSDNEAEGEAEDEEVPLHDRRFSPSHHPISAQPEALRRSKRLASAAGRDRTHDGEDRGGERTPSDAGIRPRSPLVLRTQDFDVVGLGGSLADFSVEGRRRASPQEVRTDADVERGPVETEEARDARLDREEERLRSLLWWEGRFAFLDEQRRQRDLETGGGGRRDVAEEAVQGEFDYEGQDAAAGGGSHGGRRGDEETAGVPEGQDVVLGSGSPSVPEGQDVVMGRGDSETAGDEGQGAAVCSRGEGGPDGDGDTAGVGGEDGPDSDDDEDHGPEDDPYRLALVLRDPAVPPLRLDDTPHTFFDADALAHAGVRGRESGAGEVGSGRPNDGGRDSAGSMPPPPAQTPEARVDTGDRTVAPGVAHSGGSPPPVRGGVGGGWSAVRRVGDRLRADYDAGRGVFTGRTPVQMQATEGGSGRPSLQMAGRMLGLSRAETRRSLVLEAAGTSTHRLRGEQFTSGEEGLLMHPGMRRHHGLSEVEARLAAGVAAGQAALDAIQRERERGIAAQAEEDEDTDTESEPIKTAARRHRAQVAAAAAAAHAAYVSGARGTVPEGEEGAGEDRMAVRPLGEAARALVGDDDVRDAR